MNMTDQNQIEELPEELRKELPFYRGSSPDYTARDLVIAFMANHRRPCNSTELMVYVYQAGGLIMKRSYFYQLMYQLRKVGYISEGADLKGSAKEWFILPPGAVVARPYIVPEEVGHGTG